LVDFLLIVAVRAFQGFLRMLPERLCCRIGAFIGWLGYLFLKRRRNVAISNAMRISPGISREAADRVARACFEKLGINFIESLLFQYLKKSDLAARFRLEMRGGVREALMGDRGALALGFHYSNWEIMGVASHLLGREIVALARPLKGHPGLNAFLNDLRVGTGLTIIPNRETTRSVMRLLKENRMVAFLGDQREKRSKAVWVELFDHKVPTSKGIVAIAMKTGAPVIPIYSIREGFLRYTVVCDEPVLIDRTGGNLEELIYRNARRINAVLERIVAEHPEEWFLVHRRFGRDT